MRGAGRKVAGAVAKAMPDPGGSADKRREMKKYEGKK